MGQQPSEAQLTLGPSPAALALQSQVETWGDGSGSKLLA